MIATNAMAMEAVVGDAFKEVVTVTDAAETVVKDKILATAKDANNIKEKIYGENVLPI